MNEITVFIKVVQAGSFSQAALQLNMPNSTVSSKVSALEKRLGISLIKRTTRRLHITAAGQTYFDRCLLGLQEIQGAESELTAHQAEPQGLLRVTAPVELGSSVLSGLLADYLKKYPKVSIEVILSDRQVELVTENIDLAIRAGPLKDSTLKAKKLGAAFFAPFAAPKYLKSVSEISHPRDLLDHQCLQFTPLGSEWKLQGPKNLIKITIPGRAVINDLNMVKNLATSGFGVALLPTFYCYPEIQSGKLIRILPDWKTVMNPVHFVYPAQKFVSPKLSSFIEFSSQKIKESLEKYSDV